MLKRTITGFVLTLIFIPFIFLGGYYFAFFVCVIAALAIHEAITIKEKVPNKETNPDYQKYPLYIKICCYIFGYFLIFGLPLDLFAHSFSFKTGLLINYGLDFPFVALALVCLLCFVVCDKRFKLLDAAYIFLMLMLISLGLKGILYIRSNDAIEAHSISTFLGTVYTSGMYLLIYIFAVTCLCDIFAYLGGMLCYKLVGAERVHKLNVRISPKKTWEGSIIGTIVAVTLGSLIFGLLINGHTSIDEKWYVYVLVTLFIAIAGQFGDLFLSSVKRTYNVKDFSALLPGHGGILDRIDSLLLNCIVAATLLSIIL